jgi:ubiquinol-cytochrome c reductase cytochrome b subunit
MASALALMFVLPWLDRSRVRSIRYKGIWSKIGIVVFVISFIGLGYLGTQPVSTLKTDLAQIFSVGYFAFFLLMPFYSVYEKTKTPPEKFP